MSEISSPVSAINILLLGNGGREHALAQALAGSPHCAKLFIAPGNGGTATVGTNVALDACNPAQVVDFAVKHNCGLVVIGPEAPLVAGVADAVRAAGIPCFGPNAEAAALEGSKTFCKEIMGLAGVPTAKYASFTSEDEAIAYAERLGAPMVVKADGLAAGKGVVVAQTFEEALAAVRACFAGEFGAAGATVLIEEMLTGPECSLLAFTDGVTVRAMSPSQDHKRALEQDKGPNTGGMGAYSPVPIVTDDEHQAMVAMMEKTIQTLTKNGIDFRGCLFGGFMLTPEGPKVLEFNVRFGDPETQVVIPRLTTDLVELMLAVAQQRLSELELSWRDEWAVTVVLTSAGYPGSYEIGKIITGIDEASALSQVTVYQAGTTLDDEGNVRTAGGRVMAVTALGTSFEEARERSYAACDCIQFEGKTLRRDIGLRALRGRSAWDEN
ncbi:phosphoribosylamine--glycine ligase [Collinsella sp. zg1085]|uniref:phosphoribosylamine--glycine ligase n=1 Tax=Collinsella sp. zg1085 TaxID=2844380 RepID=UPI001C0D966A|nr:phosphoribosylamine--glycine ligase [Collinsella sp. zg1085]QWT17619.1 phosphoribosylamine--glycine ligase [Collinsella sp. zg1085]